MVGVLCHYVDAFFRPKCPTQGLHFLIIFKRGFALSGCVFLDSVLGSFCITWRGRRLWRSRSCRWRGMRREIGSVCDITTMTSTVWGAFSAGRRGPPNTVLYVHAADGNLKRRPSRHSEAEAPSENQDVFWPPFRGRFFLDVGMRWEWEGRGWVEWGGAVSCE